MSYNDYDDVDPRDIDPRDDDGIIDWDTGDSRDRSRQSGQYKPRHEQRPARQSAMRPQPAAPVRQAFRIDDGSYVRVELDPALARVIGQQILDDSGWGNKAVLAFGHNLINYVNAL